MKDFFFLVLTIPRNREGTVEEEETRSGLCRSFEPCMNQATSQRARIVIFQTAPICILINLFDTQSPTEGS